MVQAADTLNGGERLDIKADMVVLATAAMPQAGRAGAGAKAGHRLRRGGWLSEAHPKLRPVETNTAGIFLAGACQGPKDIPESVAQASAAAAKALGLFAASELQRDPVVGPGESSGARRCFPPASAVLPARRPVRTRRLSVKKSATARAG